MAGAGGGKAEGKGSRGPARSQSLSWGTSQCAVGALRMVVVPATGQVNEARLSGATVGAATSVALAHRNTGGGDAALTKPCHGVDNPPRETSCGVSRIRSCIAAPRPVAWGAFTDLTCWADWNSVLTKVQPGADTSLVGGNGFSCSLRPFVVSIPFAVHIELADPRRGCSGSLPGWACAHGTGTTSRRRRGHALRQRRGPRGADGGARRAVLPAVALPGTDARFLLDLKAEAERRAAGHWKVLSAADPVRA